MVEGQNPLSVLIVFTVQKYEEHYVVVDSTFKGVEERKVPKECTNKVQDTSIILFVSGDYIFSS